MLGWYVRQFDSVPGSDIHWTLNEDVLKNQFQQKRFLKGFIDWKLWWQNCLYSGTSTYDRLYLRQILLTTNFFSKFVSLLTTSISIYNQTIWTKSAFFCEFKIAKWSPSKNHICVTIVQSNNSKVPPNSINSVPSYDTEGLNSVHCVCEPWILYSAV